MATLPWKQNNAAPGFMHQFSKIYHYVLQCSAAEVFLPGALDVFVPSKTPSQPTEAPDPATMFSAAMTLQSADYEPNKTMKMMKMFGLLAFACASCSRDTTGHTEDVVAPSPPPPPPLATPHPATGARQRATTLFPDLAVKGSTFNQTFLDLAEQEKHKNANALTEVDWPLTIARKTAAILGVKPVPEAAPTPKGAKAANPTPTPKPINPLERGAYKNGDAGESDRRRR